MQVQTANTKMSKPQIQIQNGIQSRIEVEISVTANRCQVARMNKYKYGGDRWMVGHKCQPQC